MAKTPKIGSESINALPTIRDNYYFVDSVRDIELPAKVKIYDVTKVKIRRIEETSRENVLKINGGLDNEFEVKTEKPLKLEVGDPIKSVDDAEDLLINVSKSQIETIEELMPKLEKVRQFYIDFIKEINSEGLQYDEKGENLIIKAKIEL